MRGEDRRRPYASANTGRPFSPLSRLRVWQRAFIGVAVGGLVALPFAFAHPVSPAAATTPGANPANCPGGVLTLHGPITISSDAGFTAANGVTGGSGTTTDPYMVSCWSITVPVSATGITVTGTITKAFTIHDVALTGPGSANNASFGINMNPSSMVGNVTVQNVTATGVSNGLFFQGGITGILLLQANRVNNTYNGGLVPGGISVTTPANAPLATIVNNIVTSAGPLSVGISLPAAGPVLAQANTVTGSAQAAFGIELGRNPTLAIATGNDVVGFSNVGVLIGGGGATATNNTVRGNGVGFRLSIISNSLADNSVIAGNDIENSAGAGIDITGSVGSLIRNNTILNNGSAGILADAAQPAFPPSASNYIDGNTIGGSDFGIAFAFDASSNTVQNTHWADGHQSYVRFGDTASIVDAGSAPRGVAGSLTSFPDWIVHVVPGSIAPASCNTQGCIGTTTLVGATGATFNFGDGTAPQSLTPADFPNVGSLLTHRYTATGTYTATLTVNATDTTGAPVIFAGSTPVTIVAPPATSLVPPPAGSTPWPMLGNSPDRPFYNGAETTITKGNVSQLVPKWRFLTNFNVTASPAVATVTVPPPVVGGVPTQHKVVFDGAFDGTFYAIDAATGLPVWQKCLVTAPTNTLASCDPQFPGNASAPTDYGVITASPEVVTLASGQQEVLAAANATMNALDAGTGKVLWSFNGGVTGYAGEPTCPQVKGQGCEDLTYEIESSPVVVGNTVLVGIDCNGMCQKGGGIYALDARDGHMLWFFDPGAGQSFPGSATKFVYNPKMNGPSTEGTCGGVWTSPAVDASLNQMYASTANCPTQPLPPFEEAVFALNIGTGAPVWQYQPRQLDAIDMDFSATPNVFKLGSEDVVGAGSKDGTYTLLDAAAGTPLWSSKVALGGSFGGFYNASTDGARIYLTSALGEASGFAATPVEETLKGREFALDARTGNVLWRDFAGGPTLGQNGAVSGVYFTGGLDHLLHAWASDTGNLLTALPLAGAASSGPAIAGGEVFIGAGTGATFRSAVGPCDPVFGAVCPPAPVPVGEYGEGIWGFCISTDPACATSLANLNNGKHPTKVTYTGATSGDLDDPATVSATLTDTSNPVQSSPVANERITFSLGPQTCSAITNSNGSASCSVTPNGPAGTSTVYATFTGDNSYQSSSTSAQFTVNPEQTTLTYTGPTAIPDGGTVSLSAKLQEDGSTAIQGRAVRFTLGSGSTAQTCTGSTGSDGTAKCAINGVIQPIGPGTVTASFPGDNFFVPASASANITANVFTGAGKGAFVIGDGNAVVGNTVTFWGAQWASANTLSGGSAPGSFKGFASSTSPSPPNCGGSWTAVSGTSAGQPTSVPRYMAVLVTSSITPGPTGNIREIVAIATNPGYDGSAHPGTGKVLGVICHM